MVWADLAAERVVGCGLVPAPAGKQGGINTFTLSWAEQWAFRVTVQVAAENIPDIDAEIDFLDSNVTSYEVPKYTHFYE